MSDSTDYKGRRVLVTGADGFIGSTVVERLVEAGADVTALALYNSFDSHGWLDDIPEPVRHGLRIERGDVRDPAFMMRLSEDQDVVFHLAALIAIPHSYVAAQSYVDVNVTGTVNLLEAARVHRPRRVVMTSTSEVYGTARISPIPESHPLHGQSPYSASKIAADMMTEAYVRSFAVPAVILRPFNTYGPRQSERAVIASTIRQALDPACDAIDLGDLSTERDFQYVGDTADAFLVAGAHHGLTFGEAYNAGTGQAVTIGEMVDQVRRAIGTNKPVREEAARLRPENSEVRALLADPTRFHDATGWSAATNLADGLDHTIAWWRARIAGEKVRASTGYVT
jgi:UDP-glucose 4-epimerase